MNPRKPKPSRNAGFEKNAAGRDICHQDKTQQTARVDLPVGRRTTNRNKDYLTPRGGRGEPIKFFTIADVAEIVGVATRTVRRWIKSR
jgi:hypothetical protein